MDNLVKLQIINLFKKYDYMISELEMKNEISSVSQNIFKDNIKKILSELRLEDESKEDKNSQYEDDSQISSTEHVLEQKNDGILRALYRRIVKLTHPDKIKNDYLNNLYLQATDAIDKNDKLNIFRICVILEIEIDIDEDLVDILENEIKVIEKKILFLESSFHMKWHNSSKDKKIDIILEYLKKNNFILYEV